jgi:glutamate-ammonia-ligase adenylyltransferase
MAIKLNALPPLATPRVDAWLAELPPDQQAALGGAHATLGPLLESAPYLLALAQANTDWLVATLADSADGAFADIIDIVETLGRTASSEEALSPVLRIAKGRTAAPGPRRNPPPLCPTSPTPPSRHRSTC